MRCLYENLERGGASALVLALAACNPAPSMTDTTNLETSTFGDGDGDPGDGDGDGDPGDGDPGDGDGDPGDGDGDGCPDDGCMDMGELPPPNPCTEGEDCDAIDLLIVIDNSASMAQEQLNIAQNIASLLGAFQGLTDDMGDQIDLDAHIMITSADMGHPHCATPPGYQPLKGAPQTVACINRLSHFQGPDELSLTEACESVCPNATVPDDPYIAFHAGGNNVSTGDYLAALRCLMPQGIAGCRYSSPLEAAYTALDPEATWNTGPDPFLRDGARLGILVISNGPDCSILDPEGYAFFTNPMMNTFWELNPDTGTKTQATPAVCWNAGVNCDGMNMGVYADCSTVDFGALQPIDRYISRIQDELSVNYPKDVVFLGALGVPPVTQHNPDPPYEPTAGGVDELVYREWVDGAYPMGDILPDETMDAAHLGWLYGIGPGCTGDDGMGGFLGQALPPVRVKEVCQALDEVDRVRCCIESICDSSFPNVMDCLSPI